MASPIPNSGTPHQGAIVDTPNGDWYYMGFLDAYPLGRIPVLAPIEFDAEGIPQVVTGSNGGWAQEYPVPNIQTDKTVTPMGAFSDAFDGSSLRPQWEWNHNPDNDAWSLGEGGLTLNTATVTSDFHFARNTLTTRIVGNLANGDKAGIAIIRGLSRYLAVSKSNDGSVSLSLVNGVLLDELDGSWQSVSEGEQDASVTDGFTGVADGSLDIWLRLTADLTPTFGGGDVSRNTATFEYSTDGETFLAIGDAQALHNNWEFFMAFRFAVFNFATSALGGSVVAKSFDLALVVDMTRCWYWTDA
jgi:hypothetical protein